MKSGRASWSSTQARVTHVCVTDRVSIPRSKGWELLYLESVV